ncbi:MAG: hypothetical protein JST04_04140 [Bdellovibrionales bacterium]|nr:hypothetical protein [Bdellovibrionales bacterium]
MNRGRSARHFALILAACLFGQLAGSCASSTRDEERTDDPNRTLATAAREFLPPKTEIAFPPLPLARRTHALHAGSPVGGYELVFKDHEKEKSEGKPSLGACRFTCIGGDCAIKPDSDAQMFLQQGRFVVSYSRMFGRGNRIIAYLASLKRSFEAPVLVLDCALSPAGRAPASTDLQAQLPAETVIDREKNKGLSLQESLPGTPPVYELATHRCYRRAGNPYRKAALFALTSRGIASYDGAGRALDYRIECRSGRCQKIADFLRTNGVTGCLY